MSSSGWQMVVEYLKKKVEIEENDILRPIPVEYTKEQIELLHNRQEVKKSVREAYLKCINAPLEIINEYTWSWNFVGKVMKTSE